MRRELKGFEEIVNFFSYMRVPVSTLEREKMQGDYPYYGAQGVIDYVNDYIFDGEYVLIAEDGANLVTRKQPIAQIAKGQFWVNNHAHVVRAKEGVSNNYFVNALINSMNLTGYVTGVAQPKLSQKNLCIVKVAMPSFAEQQRITAILSAYDNLIENNRRRIQLLEQAARLLYKEWFVHLRFPGHEHTTIINGIPAGWERKTLGDVVKVIKGKNITKDSVKNGSVPVVAGGLSPAYYHDTANAVGPVITVSASGANAGYVNLYHEDIWASDCSYISTTSTEYLCYFYLLLTSRQKEIFGFQKGVAQPHVYPKDVKRLLLLDPKDSIVKLFEESVSHNFQQAKMLLGQNKLLAQARDLLLPRLMKGEFVE